MSVRDDVTWPELSDEERSALSMWYALGLHVQVRWLDDEDGTWRRLNIPPNCFSFAVYRLKP